MAGHGGMASEEEETGEERFVGDEAEEGREEEETGEERFVGDEAEEGREERWEMETVVKGGGVDAGLVEAALGSSGIGSRAAAMALVHRRWLEPQRWSERDRGKGRRRPHVVVRRWRRRWRRRQ